MAPNIRRWAKNLVPARYRLLRYKLYKGLRYYPELIFSLGRRLECPFCHWHFRRFRPAGFDYPVLKEKQVVGASRHADDVCPKCMSNARERLAYLFLGSHTALFTSKLSVLHIAPEPNLARALRANRKLSYVTADLCEEDVMTRLDIMALPFRDATFDVIICNHVLEHVPDDRMAMGELCRVLKRGGWALLQVPIALALQQTVEDPSAQSAEARIRLFGQRDHARLYSTADYMRRLEESGFAVSTNSLSTRADDNSVRKYALIPEERIFIGEKR